MRFAIDFILHCSIRFLALAYSFGLVRLPINDGALANVWKSIRFTWIVMWAMRCSGFAASKHNEGSCETRDSDQVSMALSRMSRHASTSEKVEGDCEDSSADNFAPPTSEAVRSRSCMCFVTLKMPCSRINRVNGLKMVGRGLRARSPLKADKNDGDSSCLPFSLFHRDADFAAHSVSEQGSGRRMSLTERAGLWPKIETCCASITKAKNDARFNDSCSIHKCHSRSKDDASADSSHSPEYELPLRMSLRNASAKG